MKGFKSINIILYMNRLRSYVIILIKAGKNKKKIKAGKNKSQKLCMIKKKITELWIKETSEQLKDQMEKKKSITNSVTNSKIWVLPH